MTAHGWTLCIDFGTAYSKAAIAPSDAWIRGAPAEVRPLMVGEGTGGNPFLLDSALLVDDDRILFGADALAHVNALPHGKRTALRSFKTMLSAKDLERALKTLAPSSIDPHRSFTMRDLLVLYLAYLSEAVEHAIEIDGAVGGSALRRRYAAPAWREGDTDLMHRVIVDLFAEAEGLRSQLRGSDWWDEGELDIDAARKGLEAARRAPQPAPMGLVYEATAAAAYTSIASEYGASHVIVLDVGAGTTDVAATRRSGDRIEELREARFTLQKAGDQLDRIIANVAIDSRRLARDQRDQAALWTYLMRNMRDIKESIFLDGRAILSFGGRTHQVALRDVERTPDFKEFKQAMTEAYLIGLEAVRDAAVADGRREIQSVAVGGGAAAPFVQALIRQKPSKAGKLAYVARPSTPGWAHADAFQGNLAPVFPQLAVSIGGALAGEHMLATPNS